MHRAERNNFGSGQLHHLQVIPVVEVEGLIPGHTDANAFSEIILPVEVFFHVRKRLRRPGDLLDAIQVQPFLHNLADPVHTLLEALMAGLALQNRNEA